MEETRGKKFSAGLALLMAGGLAASGCCTQKRRPECVRFGGWDAGWMAMVKASLDQGAPEFRLAFEQLASDADVALEAGVYSVTFKDKVPPSGSKHDYMSMAPYWWPDPGKPDGMPYVSRDGEVNPERDKLDSTQLKKMADAVRTLSLAWFFTERTAYAEKAASLLKTWFLDEATLMNPHLDYSQGVPGIVDGRYIGIIDGRFFAGVVDAIALLETSGALTEDEIQGLRHWFERYFRWLTESDFGKQEDAHDNNHSVAYDAQACAIAYFLGKDDYVAKKVGEMPARRIDRMIEEDGAQPRELMRTRAFSYSVTNLRYFFDAGQVGLHAGVNVFGYVNPKGGSLRKALDYLVVYIGRERDWPRKQISDWRQVEDNLGALVREAALVYGDEAYRDLWFNVFAERLKGDWRVLVEPGPRP